MLLAMFKMTEGFAASGRGCLATEKAYGCSFFLSAVEYIKKRSLIGKLGTYGLMPKYGFPTEVVELKIRSNGKESGELELQRDMKLALSEYAPGNQVVAGVKCGPQKLLCFPVVIENYMSSITGIVMIASSSLPRISFP